MAIKLTRVRVRNTSAFVLLLLVLLLWLTYDSPALDPELQDSARQTRADYFLELADMQLFAPDGSLINRLKAQKLEFFASQETSQLTAPQIAQNQRDSRRWIIEAPAGKLDNRAQTLALEGQVTIRASLEAGQQEEPAEKITTYDLLLDFGAKSAHTDARVEIISPGVKTHGKGFQIDFEQQQLTINSQVETEFADR